MDTRRRSQHELVEAAVGHLRMQGIGVEVLWRDESNGAGPRLRLHHGGQDTEYATKLAHALGSENIGAITEWLRTNDPQALLVADYVSPSLAETLRGGGYQFLDAAGNAYLQRPPWIIWVSGMKRRPDARILHRSGGRAFQSAGVRVVFALLCRPEWSRLPYRELARVAGVAHGSVGEVVAELRELGFLGEILGERRLLQRGRLQLQWAEAYARVLRRKLRLGRYRAADLRRLADPSLVPPDVRVGGEVAAARLVTNLQPATAVLYGPPPTNEMLQAWRLSPDPEGNVEYEQKFWQFDDAAERFAPAPLVHADLLVSGDQRCLDAAREIQERIDAGSL